MLSKILVIKWTGESQGKIRNSFMWEFPEWTLNIIYLFESYFSRIFSSIYLFNLVNVYYCPYPKNLHRKLCFVYQLQWPAPELCVGLPSSKLLHLSSGHLTLWDGSTSSFNLISWASSYEEMFLCYSIMSFLRYLLSHM